MSRLKVALSILLLLSCSTPEPVYSLSEEQWIAILVDMHMSEALLSRAPAIQKDSVSQIFYNKIFEIHGISKEEFDENMDKLRSHPEYLEILYQKVLNEVKRKEAKEK